LAQPVKLGDEVELPDAEWADYYQLHNHSAPPYYVPSNTAELVRGDTRGRLPTSWELDNLGLGECPPKASGSREFIIVRDGRRGINPATTESDDEDDDLGPQTLNGYAVKVWLDKTFQSMKSILEILQGYDEFEEIDYALESIDRTRAVLTDIEQTLRGETKTQ
jgi:hypothetical protein